MSQQHRMRILTESGVEVVEVARADDRSTVGGYWAAAQRYLETGESVALDGFRDAEIAGRPLLTDLDAIDRWARRDELSFEDVYAVGER